MPPSPGKSEILRARLKEGEIVAVNAHGDIYRLDQRTTGDAAPEIEARLAGLDRASLMSVADTKEVMREAARDVLGRRSSGSGGI